VATIGSLDDHTGLAREAEEIFDILSKPSPRNQWNVSNMVRGDRFTQRPSMLMAMNLLRNGQSSELLRLA
jgi:hypothetical protein